MHRHINTPLRCHVWHDDILQARDHDVFDDLLRRVEAQISTPGSLEVYVTEHHSFPDCYCLELRYDHSSLNWTAIFEQIKLVDQLRDLTLYLLREGHHKIVLVVDKHSVGGARGARTPAVAPGGVGPKTTEAGWLRTFDSTELLSTYKSRDFVDRISILVRNLCVGLIPTSARYSQKLWVLTVERVGDKVVIEFNKVFGQIDLRAAIQIIGKYDIAYSDTINAASREGFRTRQSEIWINLAARSLRILINSRVQGDPSGTTVVPRGHPAPAPGAEAVTGMEHLTNGLMRTRFMLIPETRKGGAERVYRQ